MVLTKKQEQDDFFDLLCHEEDGDDENDYDEGSDVGQILDQLVANCDCLLYLFCLLSARIKLSIQPFNVILLLALHVSIFNVPILKSSRPHTGTVTRITGAFTDYCAHVMQSCKIFLY